CVLRGCVPKKLLVYGTQFRHELEDAAGFGWQIEGARLDWGRLIEAKNRELSRLEGIYVRMLRESGVKLHEGFARVVDPHTVELDGRRLTAERILVATGGAPTLPPIAGVELAITSDEALELRELPRRLAIVGG